MLTGNVEIELTSAEVYYRKISFELSNLPFTDTQPPHARKSRVDGLRGHLFVGPLFGETL